jgi:transposase
MPRGNQLTDYEKGRIDALHLEGRGCKYIANQLKRSVSGIRDYVTKRRAPGTKKRNGRPRKLTERDERHIYKSVSNTSKSSTQIKNENQLSVSSRTIRRAIQRNPNLMRMKMKTAPKLSPEHMCRRLEFAKKNMGRNWNIVSCLIFLKYSL